METRLAVMLGGALSLSAAAVHATPGKLKAEALAYAKEHGLPTRTVTAGPAQRPAERLFVPILREGWEEFHQRFSAKNGGVILRYTERANGAYPAQPVEGPGDVANQHLAMAIEPQDNMFWGGVNLNGSDRRNTINHWWHRAHGHGGFVMAVDLEEHLPHLRSFIAGSNREGNCGNNCMEWLPNAEVAPGEALFHALGITRSKHGPNMKAKLLHAANSRLEVVGVPVGTIEEFNALTREQLLGAPPAGGVEDAAR
jgi:hypothetical protein